MNLRLRIEYFWRSARNYLHAFEEVSLLLVTLEVYSMILAFLVIQRLLDRYSRVHMISPLIPTPPRSCYLKRQPTHMQNYPMKRLQPLCQWRIFNSTGNELMSVSPPHTVAFTSVITRRRLLTTTTLLCTLQSLLLVRVRVSHWIDGA